MRAALYARYSDDQQNPASIADQMVVCRQLAQRLGADVVAEFSDAAISGAAAANRPGLGAMMASAKVGAFDLVISEALDRLTRSGGDAWDIYEDLKASGVGIHTVAEGETQTLHIGLKGTMNALFLEELARKTRRGQAGVAREGRHAGGAPAYGYRRVRKLDAAGELIPGLLEVDDVAAEVVVGVFRDYAAGRSPRAIAARLNAEGVPGPRGGQWNASTINGNAKRGNGLLHNQLYAGALVWGRHTWSKDRRTGTRRAREADAASIVRTAAPELRIVPADLWQRVHERYAEVSHDAGDGAEVRPERARRSKRLLSGLVRCGCCSGPMIYSGPGGRLQCTIRKERGAAACDNGRTAPGDVVEARVLEAIRTQLLHPEVIEAAVEEFRVEYARLAGQKMAQRHRLEKELGEVGRRAERLVDQIADGLIAGPAVNGRLRTLEERRAEIEAELSGLDDGVVRLHPGIAGKYRQLTEQLMTRLAEHADATTAPDAVQDRARENAREALRALITGVLVIPEEGRGNYRIELEGDLGPLLQLEKGVRLSLGAGAGFEPATFRL
jgi:site-specific DNA recombinase